MRLATARFTIWPAINGKRELTPRCPRGIREGGGIRGEPIGQPGAAIAPPLAQHRDPLLIERQKEIELGQAFVDSAQDETQDLCPIRG
jgi:hypothetical protein